MIDEHDLENRFMHHPPRDDAQAKKYEDNRKVFLKLAKFVVNRTPESREQSLAITRLEEAMFYANAAIARHGG